MERGTIVGDLFAIEREAGEGGMGTVYRARDRRSGQLVALKVLGAPGTHNAERFVREAEILAGLSHPGIVRYVAHGRTAEGRLYLAMEWLEGQDLAALLAQRGLTMAEGVEIATRAADALGAAHRRGIVHRDVKPSNLFLVGGDVAGAKLIDFGIARLSTRTRVTTRTGAVVGTPGYLAPEQARGEHEVTAATDVFSLGCVLFEMITGRPPFAGEHAVAVLAKILAHPAPRAAALREGVPAELDDLVARMLAKDPALRPPDGAAVAEELRSFALLASGDRLRSARSAPPPAITAREQRLVSVLLASGEDPGSRSSEAPTIPHEEASAQRARLRELARAFGGKLDQLLSGAILVTLSGSGSATDQAARAARCALAMREALPAAPMVLATGLGVVAERLPVGEVIDRAARMLAAAEATPGGALHIDDATAGLLDARFDVAGAPGARRLRGEREAASPVRTLLGRPSPCLGRDRELGLLGSLFDECAAEPVARAALVTAPPGAGKSRLRQELCARLEKRAEVWVGEGDPVGTASPFGLLGRALRRAIGIREGDPPAARRDALRERIARRVAAGEQEAVAEFLGELLGVSIPGSEGVQLRAARLDPSLMSDRMRWAFGRWLRAEAEARPVVLVLEDLHWGDYATVKLVDAALRDLDDGPLLVIALARPEVDERFPGLWKERGVITVHLPPLTRRTSERLCREHLGERADPAAVARIVERADGNALYLEELIRAVAEGKGDDLPETVLAMLEARLERLAPEARRLLRAASVFGPVFWEGSVRALLGGDTRTTVVQDLLRELVEREVISLAGESRFAGERAYAFRHALVREAAYATLTGADRALGHQLAAAWLERAGERDAALVGEHLERGGERARAASRYRQAAEQALAGGDLEAALAWAARAGACGAAGEELGSVRRIEAEARAYRGENAEAARAGMEAMALLAPGSAELFQAAADVATAKSRLGDNAALAALGDDLAAAEPAPGALGPHLVALVRTATHLLHVGYEDRVAQLVARVEDLCARGEAVEPGAMAWLERMRAIQALHGGDPAAYLELTRSAAASFEAAGDLRNACVQRGNVGYAYLELGAHTEAERALRGALAAARSQGIDHGVALIKHNLGLAVALGDPGERRGIGAEPGLPGGAPIVDQAEALAEAERIEAEAASEFEAQGHRRLLGFARWYLGIIRALAGDREGAERLAREASEALEGTPPGRAPVQAWRARLALEAGRLDEARALDAEATAVLESLGGIEEGESIIRLVHAEVLRASGEIGPARAAIERARDRLLERALRISHPDLRRSFLERVPENARTLALAAAWGAGEV